MVSATMLLALSMALILANGFFVASEFALVKMRPTRLETLAGQGHKRARTALGISHRLDAYLSANQLGITLASLGLGWLGEPAFAKLIEPLLSGFGFWSTSMAHSIAIGMGFGIITLLHVVIGELVPKSLALQLTEPVALWTALPLRVFYLAAFPLIWSFNIASRLVLRLLRLRPASEAELLHSPAELRLVVQHAKLDAGARVLIDRLFDYTQRVARQVMTLRQDVVVLDASSSLEENIEIVLLNQFTRYPLVERENDRVLGYVHLKDITAALAMHRPPKQMRDIARAPIFASEETSLDDLRRELQRRDVHLAIIRDQAGTFVGIITLEDLLEEFVGEIRDEHDQGEIPPIVQIENGGFEADGRLTIDVAIRELGIRLPDVPRGVETIGDYVLAKLGRPPLSGDTIQAGCHRLRIIEVRDRKVKRLRGDLSESGVDLSA